jgi:DNA polymerase-3 subunit delta
MMSKRRLVTLQRLEEWESKPGQATDDRDSSRSRGADAFERLLEYAKEPSPTTVLILAGGAVDKRRKLVTAARSEGWLVGCEPLGRGELPGFASKAAQRLGGRFEPGVAELVAELAGPELGAVADAVDRLCLYANGEPITEEMVSENVVRLRTKTVWELIGAVGRRDVGAALTALEDVFDPNEGVRLVGLLAWSARQLVRFEAALQRGHSAPEAAQQAGAPPFKARELSQQLKSIPRGALAGWLVTLAEMDKALKGGSKLPSKAILERGVLDLCRSGPAQRPGTA